MRSSRGVKRPLLCGSCHDQRGDCRPCPVGRGPRAGGRRAHHGGHRVQRPRPGHAQRGRDADGAAAGGAAAAGRAGRIGQHPPSQPQRRRADGGPQVGRGRRGVPPGRGARDPGGAGRARYRHRPHAPRSRPARRLRPAVAAGPGHPVAERAPARPQAGRRWLASGDRLRAQLVRKAAGPAAPAGGTAARAGRKAQRAGDARPAAGRRAPAGRLAGDGHGDGQRAGHAGADLHGGGRALVPELRRAPGPVHAEGAGRLRRAGQPGDGRGLERGAADAVDGGSRDHHCVSQAVHLEGGRARALHSQAARARRAGAPAAAGGAAGARGGRRRGPAAPAAARPGGGGAHDGRGGAAGARQA